MKRLEREWRYEERFDKRKRPIEKYVKGVTEFIEFAKQQGEYQFGYKIRYACSKCKNLNYVDEYSVEEHLISNGFLPNYNQWICHGESYSSNPEESQNSQNHNTYRDMVVDALKYNIFNNSQTIHNNEEDPNPQAKEFFDMLNASEKPLFERSRISLLQAASRVVTMKSEFNMSFQDADAIASLLEDSAPEENVMTRSYYNTMKVLKGLQLPHKKIHACEKGCMLFWKDDALLDKCKDCGSDRYVKSEGEIVLKGSKKGGKGKKRQAKKPILVNPLTYFPLSARLQRLYATKNIAEQMRWHKENLRKPGHMCHPSDGEEWKRFDEMYPEFSQEPRNVRLGLCTDGFAPFSQFGKKYSSWPVMVTPYNLPPWLCLKRQFIFLALLIPGPDNPKDNLDVYMQPLVEELQQLWEVGVETYDVSLKQNFHLKASLLWTINDFPAYGMLSGWSTAGRKACPCCMENSKAFWLPNGNKISLFDCHRQFLPMSHVFRKNKRDFKKGKEEHNRAPNRLTGEEIWQRIANFPTTVEGTKEEFKELKKKKNGWSKRSIFWNLPYWKTMLIRHNLDVMHIEKNFFGMLINAVMDVEGKTCDTVGSRKDLRLFCDRRQLHIRSDGQIPKSIFALDKTQRKLLCEWLTKLKFPDGYASNFRRCVDVKKLKLHGMKSHDCHIFMERLLPIALKHLVPPTVWNAIMEISQFFRDCL